MRRFCFFLRLFFHPALAGGRQVTRPTGERIHHVAGCGIGGMEHPARDRAETRPVPSKDCDGPAARHNKAEGGH